MSDSQVVANSPVNIYMKILDAKNLNVLYDTGDDYIKSDTASANIFLRHHGKNISLDLSGYSGDISSSELTSTTSIEEDLKNQQFQQQLLKHQRWSSIGSTISSIPGDLSRVNRPTISSGTSSIFNSEDSSSLADRRADGNREPLLTSSKIGSSFITKDETSDDSIMTSTKIEVNDKMDDHSSSKLSNGDGEEMEGVEHAQTTQAKDAADIAKVESSDVKKPGSDDAGNQPRGRGRKRRKNTKSDSNDSKNSSVGRNTQKVKRLRKGLEIFDSSSNESSMDEEKVTTTTGEVGKASLNSSLNVNSNSKTFTDVSQSGSSDNSPAVETSSGSRRLEPIDTANLSSSATLWGCIGIGEWVFARWRDKNYYSGKITEKGLNDTWNIHFEDNMDGVASETHILPIKIIGVNVKAVYSPDNIFRPSLVTVTGQKFNEADEEKVEYAIQCDDLPVTLLCQRKQLSLKESEAKELRRNYQSTLPKAADLSLDNILAGPRRRGVGSLSQSRKIVGGAFDSSLADDSILKDSGVGTPTPKKPVPSKLTSGTKASNASSSLASSELESSADTGYLGTPSAAASTPKPSVATSVQKDTPKVTSVGTSVQKDTPKGVKESVKKGKSKDKLFDSYQFFLTASGGGDPSSSGDDAPELVLPYDKDEYKDSIESKGGKVIDSVGRERGRDNVFLISDSHARTVKYIYCLAAGIPCVSHTWIGQCLEKNTVVDWKPFELNSGWSLEEQRVIPAHQKKPLKHLKVYVTAEQDDLYNYWKPVLLAAEASLVKPKKKPYGVPADTEILVTDSSCSQEVLDMVKRNNIPLVKPEWLVQTIITGTRAAYTGHTKYHVNPSGELEEEDE